MKTNLFEYSMNFEEIIINLMKNCGALRGNTYKFTHISFDNCPKVTQMVSK